MARLILGLLFLCIAVIAVQVIARFLRGRPVRVPQPAKGGDLDMPSGLQNVAYVLLILVMLGVTSGWIGSS